METRTDRTETPDAGGRVLRVVMYHYVRDLPTSAYPRLKGLLWDDFRRQVVGLQERYEMATLESAEAFLQGAYTPARDLCLLTFDDGLREHHAEVTPFLQERGLCGLFFISTSCVERQVAAVHKNHFLMASLDFDRYRQDFIGVLQSLDPTVRTDVCAETASTTYVFDRPEVAAFKYLLNFQLSGDLRGAVLDRLFAEHLGDETRFAHELYLDWPAAREMQDAGMVLGGHAHRHVALGVEDRTEQADELGECYRRLVAHLRPQSAWPFAYPFGSYTDATAQLVEEAGFSCAFTTDLGANGSHVDRFKLKRFDTNDITV